jgi:DNA-binding IscR family transcriptional regulator
MHLAAIMELFQGAINLTECLFRKKLCRHRASCVLRHRLMAIEASVRRKFARITIAQLLKDLNEA